MIGERRPWRSATRWGHARWGVRPGEACSMTKGSSRMSPAGSTLYDLTLATATTIASVRTLAARSLTCRAANGRIERTRPRRLGAREEQDSRRIVAGAVQGRAQMQRNLEDPARSGGNHHAA